MRDWRLVLVAMMVQDETRSAFDSLATKNHVTYALIHHGDRHNDLPSLLAAIIRLGGSTAQLQIAYHHRKMQLEPWPMSPSRVGSPGERLGDVRFQRAYVDFFSLEMTRYAGNAKAMALEYLVTGSRPVIYGLFGGFGQPLISLADAFDLSTPIVFVQSMVLACIDWSDMVYRMLAHAMREVDMRGSHPLAPPGAILSRIATDGRLAGVMRGSGGYHEVQRLLANEGTRTVVCEYVLALNVAETAKVLPQLAELSVLLLCGTHRPGRPAFDFYFSQLPGFVQALGILLPEMEDEFSRRLLVRGVWMLFILAYITQLRPILDERLITDRAAAKGPSWSDLLSEFHAQADTLQGKYLDSQFLQALRGLLVLAQRQPEREDFFLSAAYKLREEWSGWTGHGIDGAESLNIRL